LALLAQWSLALILGFSPIDSTPVRYFAGSPSAAQMHETPRHSCSFPFTGQRRCNLKDFSVWSVIV
jgi:hypothetical protein